VSTAKASSPETLSSRFDEPADLFRVLANPTRLMLLCHIAKGECSVGQMERALGLRQPGLSQQLGELRQKGLLQSRRESRSIFYAIADPRILTLLDTLPLWGVNEPHADPELAPAGPQTEVIQTHTRAPVGERATFARVTRELSQG